MHNITMKTLKHIKSEKPLYKKLLVFGLLFLLIGVSTLPIMSSVEPKQKTVQIIDSETTTQKESDVPLPIIFPNAKINPIGSTTPEMFSADFIHIRSEKIQPIPSITTAQIADAINTFVMTITRGEYSDSLILSLNNFTWNSTVQIYMYGLLAPYRFQDNGTTLAVLTGLYVCFYVVRPYNIRYSYQIQTQPVQYAIPDMVQCHVTCSALGIKEDLYMGRISSGEGFYENIYDFDNIVTKQSLGYTGDPYDTMVEFCSTNGVFQRGYQYMGCNSDGCSGSVFFNYPIVPGYFEIIGGPIDFFWIDSGWEGTSGDRYASSQEFTVELINNPPQTPPRPTGPERGIVTNEYNYSIQTTDPDEDQLQYGWDWNGDFAVDEWTGFVPSGTQVTMPHRWSVRGIFDVRVKTKDIHDAESNWSPSLTVNMYKLGDVNNDGFLSWRDFDPFVAAMNTNENQYQTQYPGWVWVAADCNQDCYVTWRDIDPFILLFNGG